MESNFWSGFFKSIDCEPKDVREIQGASGIKHNILGLGIDEQRKRLTIVQDEQDARILTMVQADVQAKIKDYNILMVRPVSINLSMVFSSMALLLGTYKLTNTDLEKFKTEGEPNDVVEANKEKVREVLELVSPQIEIINKTKPNLVPVFKEVVQQLSHLKFLSGLDSSEKFSMDFGELLNFNPVIYDNSLGICPIPLYNFSVQEAESFFNPKNVEVNKHILQKHAIHQFFYPPADALALGMIENENLTSKEIIARINEVPKIGHPFGKNELTDFTKVSELIDALKAQGLVAEGEYSMSVTEEGKEKVGSPGTELEFAL